MFLDFKLLSKIKRWGFLKYNYINLAISLEIRPLAALYPPPYIFFRLINRKGLKCRRHEHTAPVDHWKRRSRAKHFFYGWGEGGYNAAKGLISREITKISIQAFGIEKPIKDITKKIYFIVFTYVFNSQV